MPLTDVHHIWRNSKNYKHLLSRCNMCAPKDCTSYVAVRHLSPLEKIVACTLGVVIRCLQVFKETPPVGHRALITGRTIQNEAALDFLEEFLRGITFLQFVCNLEAVIPTTRAI